MSSVLPKLSERDFMEQVTQLAEIRGWSWAHFRPAETAKGWRTPVSGPLGKGWPDLVLVRPHDRRLIFAELKSDYGAVSPEQAGVISTLAAIEHHPTPMDIPLRSKAPLAHPSIEVVVWRPMDWDKIEVKLA